MSVILPPCPCFLVATVRLTPGCQRCHTLSNIRDTPQIVVSVYLVQSLLIIVQRDAIQSSLFIILRVHSTCFGCQPHPSSGVHKTVTTASGTCHIFCVQLPPCNVAKLAWLLLMMGVLDTRNGEVRVVSRGQGIVSVASQGDRFKRISCVPR